MSTIATRLVVRCHASQTELFTSYYKSEADALLACKAVLPAAHISPDGYGIVRFPGTLLTGSMSSVVIPA